MKRVAPSRVAFVLLTVLAVGCADFRAMQSVRSSIQEGFGWEDVSVDMVRSADQRTIHVRIAEEVDPATGDSREVAREVADLAAERFALGDQDSVVVTFESGTDSGVVRESQTETFRFGREDQGSGALAR